MRLLHLLVQLCFDDSTILLEDKRVPVFALDIDGVHQELSEALLVLAAVMLPVLHVDEKLCRVTVGELVRTKVPTEDG